MPRDLKVSNEGIQITGLHPIRELRIESETGITLEQKVNTWSKKSREEFLQALITKRVKLAISDEQNSTNSEEVLLHEFKQLYAKAGENYIKDLGKFYLKYLSILHIFILWLARNNNEFLGLLAATSAVAAIINVTIRHTSLVNLYNLIDAARGPITEDQRIQAEIEITRQEILDLKPEIDLERDKIEYILATREIERLQAQEPNFDLVAEQESLDKLQVLEQEDVVDKPEHSDSKLTEAVAPKELNGKVDKKK